jgi:hypothetical protein
MNKTYKKNTLNKTKKVFSKKDFDANDGFLTSVWGPTLWHSLHTISFNYPVNPSIEEKHNYKNFIINLQYVLPCKFCRINLKTNFKQLPLTLKNMENRDLFSRYIYDLHELINKMLNKKSGLSYCDIRERYEHFRARCTDEKTKLFKFSKLNKTHKKKIKEKGCTEPLYGKKSKCIINIVPQENKEKQSIKIDKKCIKTKK